MNDARDLTMKLGGDWYSSYGLAPCPVCQSERRRDQRGLTLASGRAGLLAHCKKSGCDFRAILAAAGNVPGDWHTPDPALIARRRADERKTRLRKETAAWALWRSAERIAGTPAETYLRRRGITCPLPDTLRFHPKALHGPTDKRLPAMVAWIDGAAGSGAHRTFLRQDGSGKATVQPAKAMLGTCAGGAVRLSDGPDGLVAAEGIETTLSLASGLLPGRLAFWAALSTSGMRALNLPPTPGRLIVAADGDDAGRAAAHALADRAHALGWQVETLTAPDGADFNDVLMAQRSGA